MNTKVYIPSIRGEEAMAISKVGQRRQVVIPKEICEDLGLKEGDFVEVLCLSNQKSSLIRIMIF